MTEKKTKEQVMEEMDLAAAEAHQELDEMTNNESGAAVSIPDVANWWKKWYLKAGHKRLGRILLEYTS